MSLDFANFSWIFRKCFDLTRTFTQSRCTNNIRSSKRPLATKSIFFYKIIYQALKSPWLRFHLCLLDRIQLCRTNFPHVKTLGQISDVENILHRINSEVAYMHQSRNLFVNNRLSQQKCNYSCVVYFQNLKCFLLTHFRLVFNRFYLWKICATQLDPI